MTDYRTAPIEKVIRDARAVCVEIYDNGYLSTVFTSVTDIDDTEVADIIARLVEELRDAKRDVARMDWLLRNDRIYLGPLDAEFLSTREEIDADMQDEGGK